MKISTHSLTRRLTSICCQKMNFLEISTHSLTRRLTFAYSSGYSCSKISTHSLTRRLTIHIIIASSGSRISTHSLTRRLTIQWTIKKRLNEFQLTASQGGWLLSFHHNFFNIQISTHSLTRRLTWNRMDRHDSSSHFNSQPHKEADFQWVQQRRLGTNFNSQPHKEADLNVGFCA